MTVIPTKVFGFQKTCRLAYARQGHEMLFDAHTLSFAALGGDARSGSDDNIKTVLEPKKRSAIHTPLSLETPSPQFSTYAATPE